MNTHHQLGVNTANTNKSVEKLFSSFRINCADCNASGVTGAAASTVDGINISLQTTADAAIQTINTAIETVSGERSKLGAYQNRLDHTINNLGTFLENLSAAESRIRDVDMAKEMMNQTKNNIHSQAAQAMLAQVNQQPQAILQLLREFLNGYKL
ncbi:hypothetical protein H70737_28250 [Paenibacillus sp. FSL H7-0737]|nr:hypothetical protein H70737_28250 [Paenibacillus sp. FSL H7-0737]